MLDRVKYVNSIGETLSFGENGIFINSNDLRDWELSYDEEYGTVSNFRREPTEKSLPIILNTSDYLEAQKIKNRLFEIFEKDVLLDTFGSMVINGYSLPCKIFSSKKEDYLYKGYYITTFKLVTHTSTWVKETEFIFKNQSNPELNIESDIMKQYPFGYPYGYGSNVGSIKKVINDFIVPVNFKMVIYGFADNPSIIIGDNVYKINRTIYQGESVEINSIDRTIKLIRPSSIDNIYDDGDIEYDIFKPIPIGETLVISEGIDFKIYLIEERSEPKW